MWEHRPLQELKPTLLCVRERERDIKKKIFNDCDNCTDSKLTKETARDELALTRERR
jgi:hypothetical protein